jgi:hypothetical protein
VRNRSRSESPGIRRSVSNDLFKDATEELSTVKKLVETQQDFLLELLKNHKGQVDEKLASKSRQFSSKQIEKQFQVNASFRELTAKIQQAHAVKDWEGADAAADQLAEQLETHEQDLVIADSSPHGWLAVNKLRNSTDLPKSLRKRLAVVEKELASKKQRYGGPRRKFQQFQAPGQDGFSRKPGRRVSPEEALFAASKQVRTGSCSFCHKSYHFFKECPQYWSKVNESREATAKGTSASTAA